MSAFSSLAIPNVDFGGSFGSWADVFGTTPTQRDSYGSFLSPAAPFSSSVETASLHRFSASDVAEQIRHTEPKMNPPPPPADFVPDVGSSALGIFDANEEQFLAEFLDNFDAGDQLNFFDAVSPLDVSHFDSTFANAVLSKELKDDLWASAASPSNSLSHETSAQLSALDSLHLGLGGDSQNSASSALHRYASTSLLPTATGSPHHQQHRHNSSCSLGQSMVSGGDPQSQLFVAAADLRVPSPLPDQSGKRKGPQVVAEEIARNPKRKTSLRVSLGQEDGTASSYSGGSVQDDTGDESVAKTPRSAKSGKKKAPRELLTEEQKRSNHIRSEQRRRNLISNYYENLKDYVYETGGEPRPPKMSKANLLRDSVDYVRRLQQESTQKRELLAALQRELVLKQQQL
ncbi:hypothetical protein IWQ60_003983 [Tieghemiomyces parasiticus]|uniref:BHLH domain-containing protein n=1 Tax=Tieghemiomyces parasiticus TaxID=78921 RepID=A0A9W8A999_9FUNG|nr:hypothetical protein IWQ60_003983 [Tieghemiomyces parasiticus]